MGVNEESRENEERNEGNGERQGGLSGARSF